MSGVSGTLRAWAAVGRARLTRDAQQARLIFDVRGDAEHATFKQVQAATPGGLLDFTGGVTWAPALRWDLEGRIGAVRSGLFHPWLEWSCIRSIDLSRPTTHCILWH